jgi:hypothetical protein
MANPAEQLWKHLGEGKTAAVLLVTLHYTAGCESKGRCSKRATCLECRDSRQAPYLA